MCRPTFAVAVGDNGGAGRPPRTFSAYGNYLPWLSYSCEFCLVYLIIGRSKRETTEVERIRQAFLLLTCSLHHCNTWLSSSKETGELKATGEVKAGESKRLSFIASPPQSTVDSGPHYDTLSHFSSLLLRQGRQKSKANGLTGMVVVLVLTASWCRTGMCLRWRCV